MRAKLEQARAVRKQRPRAGRAADARRALALRGAPEAGCARRRGSVARGGHRRGRRSRCAAVAERSSPPASGLVAAVQADREACCPVPRSPSLAAVRRPRPAPISSPPGQPGGGARGIRGPRDALPGAVLPRYCRPSASRSRPLRRATSDGLRVSGRVSSPAMSAPGHRIMGRLRSLRRSAWLRRRRGPRRWLSAGQIRIRESWRQAGDTDRRRYPTAERDPHAVAHLTSRDDAGAGSDEDIAFTYARAIWAPTTTSTPR